jgi:hypothetical protein
MARKKSPWPKGLRIHPENNPLADLPDEHPAKRMLIARAVCQRDCALIDLAGPDGQDGTTQHWPSALLGRDYSFAEFIYEFVCNELILTEWLEHPPIMTAAERENLAEMPQLKALLAECRAAATAENNAPILELLPKAEAFVAAWEASILARLKEDRIPLA